MPRIEKSIQTERSEITSGLAGWSGDRGVTAHRHRVSLRGDKHALKQTVVMATRPGEYANPCEYELYPLDGSTVWCV